MTHEFNLDKFLALCDAVKAANSVGPPTLLVSLSTYEQHKDWFDKLCADVCIINPMAELKQDDNIYMVPHDWEERYHYE